jgi:1-acyl-sn-glycerol-3-phosphate acyltransferase
MLYAILKPLAAALMRLAWGLRARGREHVPATGPVLLVANHSSLLDPPLIAGVTPRPVSFMAKAELFEVPLLGPLIRRVNAHPLRREGADAGALRVALRLLREGRALLVFPEGTRGEEGTLGPPKSGAGMLAVTSGAPVVPVYVQGAGRAWPRGRRWPRPGRVTVTFGAPLSFAAGGGGDRKDRYAAASREMMAAIARLRNGGRRAGAMAAAPAPGQARAEEAAERPAGRGAAKYHDGRNGQHEAG